MSRLAKPKSRWKTFYKEAPLRLHTATKEHPSCTVAGKGAAYLEEARLPFVSEKHCTPRAAKPNILLFSEQMSRFHTILSLAALVISIIALLLEKRGKDGPIGSQGPQGVQGVQGQQGVQGSAGIGVQILGNYETSQSFFNGAGSTTANQGDAYIILSDGSLYVYSTLSGWVDTGDLQGPQGIQGIQGIQGPAGGSFPPSYASFVSTENQYMGQVTTNQNFVTPSVFQYNTIAIQTADIKCSVSRANGNGSLTGDSRIFVGTSGVYKISFSAELDNDLASNQNAKVEIWYKKNGSSVPWSGSVIDILGKDSETFPFIEFLDTFSGGEFFEGAWFATVPQVHVAAYPANNSNPSTTVAVPSIITNVYRIA